MEQCEDCGFAWETVARDDIGPRVRTAARAIGALLSGAEPSISVRRPSPERWSMVEYAAHVRDVLITLRDRMVIGLVEHDPNFKPMYRDERIDLGLYRNDTADAVVSELESAAAMLVRLFDAIDPALLGRPVQYGYPSPATRDLLWMGQQAVHEVEHHRDDVDENLRLLA